ncbi:response regulator [Dyella sp. 20L07]|uniref:response regulator n=1 Tax=Dyella sp. 20L07 TaxID=3384240 RepID=UPI003D2D3042
MYAILLVDDHAMFREGILLTVTRAHPALEVHAASSGAAALATLEANPGIGLVVMDFYLPDMSGSSLVRLLRTMRRDIQILVVSASEDPADVHRALQAGAGGFIHKTACSQSLLNALSQVSAGLGYLPDTYLPSDEDAAPRDEAALLARLTPRQTEVLRLVCEGMRNAEISQRLGMTEKTVKAHMSVILSVLDVPNRTQASLLARRGGLLGKPS